MIAPANLSQMDALIFLTPKKVDDRNPLSFTLFRRKMKNKKQQKIALDFPAAQGPATWFVHLLGAELAG